VTLLDELDLDELGRKLSAVLGAESLPRVRRDKPYDLRPLIEALALTPGSSPKNGRGGMLMRLAAREGATGRPEEVLEVLGIPIESTRVERSRLIFKEPVNML